MDSICWPKKTYLTTTIILWDSNVFLEENCNLNWIWLHLFFIIIVWVITYGFTDAFNFCQKFFIHFRASLFSTLWTSVKYLLPLCSSIYQFWCHISNVVNKNIFVYFFVYHDVIQTKTFYIDHNIKTSKKK